MSTAPPLLSTSGYRANIDGLRGLAVLIVIGFHAAPQYVPGGFVGVDVFFVVSGYLISSIILDDLRDGRFTYFNFYIRRIRRLFPSLCVVLASAWLVGWFSLLPEEFGLLGKHIVASAAFLANVQLWREAGYFDVGAEFKPLLHLWSLGVEEQFYLLWPLLVVLAWRRRGGISTLAGFVILGSFVMNAALVGNHATSAFYLPHTRLWELICGALLAQLEHGKQGQRVLVASHLFTGCMDQNRAAKLSDIAAWCGLALLAISALALTGEHPFPGWWALLPVLGTSLTIWTGTGGRSANRLLSTPVLVWVGLISYPLYLWHWPILSFVRITELGGAAPVVIIAAVSLAFVLAWLTYRYVEIPIRFGIGTQFGGRTTLALLAALIGVSILGLATYRARGFPERLQHPQIDMALDIPAKLETFECMSIFPFAVQGSCALSSPGLESRPTTLLLGDSHAWALAGGLEKISRNSKSDIAYVHIGKGGCLPFLGIERYTEKGPGGCPQVFEGALNFAATHRQVTKVVIAARYAMHVSARGFGIDESGPAARWHIQAPGSRLPRNQVIYPEVFRSGLIRTIEFLRQRHIQMAFIHQIPELGFDPASCVQSHLMRFGKERRPCGVSRKDVIARQSEYREIVKNVLTRYPEIQVFDPLPSLCDDDMCYAIRNNVLLYRDNNHLSVTGAAYLLQKLGIESLSAP